MLDTKLLRTDLERVTANFKRRGFSFDPALYERLESTRKVLQVQTEELRNERNVK
jgi:seryl-tRNA synthetase